MFRRNILAFSTTPVLVLLVCASFHFARPQVESTKPDYLNPQLPVERRVADLLCRMTLEEKIAQTRALWKQNQLIMDAKGNFSPEKAETVLKNGIGEITRASEQKGPRESAEFTNAIPKFLAVHTRLGIPAIVHEESLHGFVAPGATSFPQAIALGEAVRVAKMADVVILAIGANEQTSREAWADNHLGDRDSLDLVGKQNELVKAVAATGKPTGVPA